MQQGWTAPVQPGTVGPGTPLASSTSLTDVSPAPQVTFPANFLNYPGARVWLHAFGTFSNTSTPTLLIGFYYGGVAGTALAATGATTTTVGATSWPWSADLWCELRGTGSSGTIMCQGNVKFPTSLTAVSEVPIPSTALATVTIDTTAAKAVTVGAQWGTNSASNTLTCQMLSVVSVY